MVISRPNKFTASALRGWQRPYLYGLVARNRNIFNKFRGLWLKRFKFFFDKRALPSKFSKSVFYFFVKSYIFFVRSFAGFKLNPNQTKKIFNFLFRQNALPNNRRVNPKTLPVFSLLDSTNRFLYLFNRLIRRRSSFNSYPSYSFFTRRSLNSIKNVNFVRLFASKVSNFFVFQRNLDMQFYKYFFLNSNFFIRLRTTNSNFFVNFGFYDRVILQFSAGGPTTGFSGSARSSIPAVIALTRYFSGRLRIFLKFLFPALFNPKSRRLFKRRPKIPVFFIIDRAFDKKSRIAFGRLAKTKYFKVLGFKVDIKRPHSLGFRSKKARRR